MAPADCRASLRSLSPTPLSRAVLALRAARPAPTAPALPSGPCTKSAYAHFAPGPPGRCSLRSPRRYGHPSRADGPAATPVRRRGPDRLRSLLQGRPDPGPLHRASSRAVLATLRAARLQARRIHPSRPRSAARIERRHSRQLKQAVCAVTPCAPLRERCSRLRRSLELAHPPQAAPGARSAPIGRPSTSSGPPLVTRSYSPEAGSCRSLRRPIRPAPRASTP